MASFYDVPICWKDGSQTQGRAVGNNAAWLCACGEVLLGPHEQLYPIEPCPKCHRTFRIIRGQKPQYVIRVEETAAVSEESSKTRSKRPLDSADLARLARVAAEDRADLFARKPELGKLYRDRTLCVALCQGAALHFIDGKNGVKDFDVWTFYRVHPDRPYPYRRNMPRDFGDPKFGTSPDRPDFLGRRVDCLGRSIPCTEGQDPLEAVRLWLDSGRTTSARKLAEKAAVVLEPESERGRIIWPDLRTS